MAWRVLLLSLAVFHTTAVLSFGQELEIFETDDFISPDELRTDTGKSWFFASRALAGAVHDYTRRNDLLDQNVNFLRVVNNFYYAGWQFNFNLTRFGLHPKALGERYDTSRAGAVIGTNMEGVPVSRFGVETSRYFGTTEEEAVRWRLKWNHDTLASNVNDDEFGSEIEIKILGPESLVAGLQYVWKPLYREHIIGYGGRVTVWQSPRGFAALIGFGAGGELVDGDLRSGVARLQSGLTIPLPFPSSYIHVMGSLNGLAKGQRLRFYQMQRGSYEGAVFIDVPLFAHLSSPH
jgi:hypothetical protein